jgi:hypothetical protein
MLVHSAHVGRSIVGDDGPDRQIGFPDVEGGQIGVMRCVGSQ